MNILLIFFAFPLAVIIISVIFEKLLNNPIAVAALIFAVFLIITFAVFDATFLIATLAYTILALIAAFVVKIIRCRDISHLNTYTAFSDFIKKDNYNSNEQEENEIASNLVNHSKNDEECINMERRNMFRRR